MTRTLARFFSRKRTGLARVRTNHNYRVRPAMLRLEDRAVPATMNWTGGPDGNGTNWSDPVNWSPAQVPGFGDDAMLGPTGSNPPISVPNASVHSVASTRNLQLANTGTFSIGSAVSSFSNLNLGGGGFFADSGATIKGYVFASSLSNPPFSNSGVLTVDTCEFLFMSPVSNSGTLQLKGYAKIASGGFTNSGTVEVGTGGTGGNCWIGGTITTTAESIIRIKASTVDSILNISSLTTNDGLIELDGAPGNNSAKLNYFGLGNGTITNSPTGTLRGNGWVTSSVDGAGTVSPGLSGPGLLKISGNVSPEGPLVFDLKGTVAATEFDQLIVTGAKGGYGKLALSGPLSVNVGYAAKVGDSFVIVDNDDTDAVSGTFVDLPQLSIFKIGSTYFQINYKGGTGNDVELTVVPTPTRIESIVINDNMPQRSRVTSVQLAFASVVALPASPETAFELRRQSDNALVALTADVVSSTQTIVTLTFNGALSEFTSLADGRYTLTAFASKINGGSFDGNGDGTAGDNYVLTSSGTAGVFRVFGDSNGDAVVNANDFAAFRVAFGAGTSIFDFDGDNQTDANDFAQFRKRFGLAI